MQQLILFISKYRNNLLFVALLLLALVRHSLKNPVSEHHFNKILSSASAEFQNFTSNWKHYWSLDEVNEELTRENSALKASLFQNSHPSFAQSTGYSFIPAKAIEYSYKKLNNYILIDAGRLKGVQEGMGVISSKGWIGTVTETTKSFAFVTPFIHSKGAIGARIKNKGLGELVWQGDPNKGMLTDLQREFKPVKGDSIYSFTRAVVAPPILTGIVSTVSQNQEDLSWNAQVDLTVDFSNIDWLYVCSFNRYFELDSLTAKLE